MSTPTFREVRLEIVRPGTPHNQLLSPLTPYIALCGEGSPITFHIDFEHQQLLNRLEQLRYVTSKDQKFSLIPQRLREAQVGELGQELARILSRIETLSTELARAQCRQPGDSQSMVHLRIVLSGSELSLLPFEIAIAPLAYPGEGLELNLQASLPITITREIRHGGAVSIPWSRTSRTAPRVLVVYAEPGNLRVPAKEHIQVIRTAIDPWVRKLKMNDKTADRNENAKKHLPAVKDRIRVLPNASIRSIYETCSRDRFTHVHILAHGDTYEYAGNSRFGVALCSDDDPTTKEVVSGKRLVKALQAEGANGGSRCEPLVVTLATCDSGNQTSVLVPGGSLAHDLHVEGIPWVFASQFPLTVRGSIQMAKDLYPRLFRGDDPRQILFELRRQLYQGTQTDHDWASVVVYATLPQNFQDQVATFSARQIKEAIKVLLDHADSISSSSPKSGTAIAPEGTQVDSTPASDATLGDTNAVVKTIVDEVEDWLAAWLARKPDGNTAEERIRRGEILGMHGSTYKRIALLLGKSEIYRSLAQSYYGKSREYYRKTMEEAAATNMTYYWSGTQYLALQAIIKGSSPMPEIYSLVRRLAQRDTEDARADDDTKAWAHATLAELELLGTFHGDTASASSEAASEAAMEETIKKVQAQCAAIVKLKGPKSFHVGSTWRQFERYRDSWPDDRWAKIAQSAMDVLNPGGGDIDYDYPEDH